MQAMILAAGQGRRLDDRKRRPKCLRTVAGVPLLHHQVAALAAAGITDVVVVVGYEQQQIRRSLGDLVRFVTNDRYQQTNSMYSFMLGQALVHDDVLILNSDVFLHPALLHRLHAADDNALLYDTGSGQEAEQMKVWAEDGLLVQMSKTLPSTLVSGENVGVLRLTAEAAEDAAVAAAAFACEGGQRAWLATALNDIAGRHPIRCLDVVGWPWVEVDFPEDLVRARSDIFPAVAGALAALPYELVEPLLRSVS